MDLKATKALNERFFKSPLAVPGLYEILSSSDNAAVRQLAAVELRKRVRAAKQKHWKKLAPPTKNTIKAGLLQLVLKDPAQLTRHAVARVIAEIAEVDLAEKRWPELLAFINTTSGSPNPAEREIAVFTLYTLLDTVATTMSEHLPQVFAMFQKTLADPESLEVRVTTVQALGKCAEYIEADETQSIVRLPYPRRCVAHTIPAGPIPSHDPGPAPDRESGGRRRGRGVGQKGL